MSWLQTLFSSPFLPHRACLFLRPDLIVLHVGSDILIAVAYFAIPVILLYFYRKRGHAEPLLRRVLLCFAAFITFCGVTHVISAITMWIPLYYLEGVVMLMTGVVSAATAILLIFIAPRLMALRSPEELSAINDRLAIEASAHMNTAQDLREAITALSRSNRELERFAHIASHDLKAPLRAISSFSDLLQQRHAEGLSDEGREFVSFISDSVRRMNTMVDDLLRLSRLHDSNERRKLTALECCIQEAIANLSQMITERSAQIEVGPMPTLEISASQWVIVFQNLIENAIKFTPRDSVPKIRIQAERVGENWQISIADNGIGIPPQHADAVFDLFRRLHTEAEYPGTGIGLSLCHKVVERHGGRIWCAAGDERGTIFRIELPATEKA
jgi:chemotaxis family two-component system sensor kinase Cph1